MPFFERQLLRFASSRAGYKLPTATLCYVWDHMLAPGTLLDNAYTRRVRYIAAGGQCPGNGAISRHDLAADFRRAFGDETRELPPLTAVVIGADTDNTGSNSVGYVRDLRLEPAVQ